MHDQMGLRTTTWHRWERAACPPLGDLDRAFRRTTGDTRPKRRDDAYLEGPPGASNRPRLAVGDLSLAATVHKVCMPGYSSAMLAHLCAYIVRPAVEGNGHHRALESGSPPAPQALLRHISPASLERRLSAGHGCGCRWPELASLSSRLRASGLACRPSTSVRSRRLRVSPARCAHRGRVGA
jgi:hypothetical protein